MILCSCAKPKVKNLAYKGIHSIFKLHPIPIMSALAVRKYGLIAFGPIAFHITSEC